MTKTVLVGSMTSAITDKKPPTQRTMVAGSWTRDLDTKKTMLDAGSTKTVLMGPQARPVPASKSTVLLPSPAALSSSGAAPAVSGSAAPQRFDLEILESAVGVLRYRDALRRGDQEAFVVMTDFVRTSSSALPFVSPAQMAHVQRIVRAAVAASTSPAQVLASMTHELASMGVEATSTCARLDVEAERITVATSTNGPAPFIVRAMGSVRARGDGERVWRGGTRSADHTGRPADRFAEHVLPFAPGDMFLLGSREWTAPLSRIFTAPIDLALRTLTFALREERTYPRGAALLRLTMATR